MVNASLHKGGPFMAGEISALDQIKASIADGHSFVLQGGAGCGKTETLKQLIDYISEEQPDKKIACITHTNKAVGEIKSRIKDGHVVSTIHSFLNSIIKDYKKNIQRTIFELFKIDQMERNEMADYADEKEQKSKEHEKYKKIHKQFAGGYFTVFGVRIDKVEGKKDYDTRPVELNQILNGKIVDLNKEMQMIIEEKGYKSVKYNETRFNDFKDLSFGHDGLLEVAALLFDRNPLLGKIVNDKFDYIFIDEYQDTNRKIISLFLDKLPETNRVLIGLFGDSMQSIYGDGIGDVKDYIQAGKLSKIEKKDNFRCSPQIIGFINTLRNDGLVQKLALKMSDGKEEPEEERNGNVEFLYAICNDKPNVRSSEAEKKSYYESLNTLIRKSSFETESKILLLSNKAISVKAEFAELYDIFCKRYAEPKEEILKVLTRLQLLDLNEICCAYKERNFNFILSKLKKSGLSIQKGSDKKVIGDAIQAVMDSDKSAIATVEMAFRLKLLKKSESFREYKNRAETFLKEIDLDTDYVKFETDYFDDGRTLVKMQKKIPGFEEDTFKEQEYNIKKKQFYYSLLSDVSFKEVANYFIYENDQTPYITMHKTKGTGIDNVLVVMEEYFWNEYDFNATFNPKETDIAKIDKNKQLIYVACSRAKLNLRCIRLVSDDEVGVFTDAFKGWDSKVVSLV
jgi:DNA helicase-2/ATP-dependent DNA helicase PcrA